MSGEKILIVEDEAILAEHIASSIKRGGFELAGIAASGEEAIQLASQYKPDLILMDVHLQGKMDGIQASHEIHTQADIPIVYLTAHIDKITLDRAKEVGPYGYIVKPFNEQHLIATLDMGLYKHRTEKILRENQARLETTLRSLPDLAIILDENGRYVEILTYRDELLYSRSIDKIIGMRLEDILPSPARQIIIDGLDRCVQTQKTQVVEYELDIEGQHYWFEGRFAPLPNNNGEKRRVILLATDISGRKAIEAALRASENKFRSIVEQALEGIVLFDGKFQVLEWNHYLEKITGVSKSSVVGKDIYQIASILKISNRSFKNISKNFPPGSLQEIASEEGLFNRSWSLEITRKHNEHRLITFSFIRPIQTDEGLIIGMVVRDVTEEKALESSLHEAQKMAGIGTLAAGIAHELNSPLQVITGASEDLIERIKKYKQGEQSPDPEAMLRRAEMINGSSWRVAQIIRALQEYAHPATGQMDLVDINTLVKESLLLIENQLKTWSNISISLELEEPLPNLLCDRNRISQALFNLITNARDAMLPGGEITISTCCNTEKKGISLSVKDNGTGIPEDIRSKIFDPFFTTKPPGSGSGLGLPMVLGVVRSHGGTIKLQSSEGDGSIFTLFFPLSEADRQPLPDVNLSGRYDDMTKYS